jgi:3,4-dihydroxy 2-butanone 4-phosphate synthase/GTP cyclohydrolase II
LSGEISGKVGGAMKFLELDPFVEVLKDVREGKPIVMVDDADRENEGDLMVAAEKVTAENINFMFQEGKGLVCISLTQDQLEKIKMPLQTLYNSSPFGTNFAVSFDLKAVAKQGVSASARAATIRAAISKDARSTDFLRPGHVFPVGAVSGGVLKRRGQTEGSVDISRIAGLHPSGVICEIMNSEGEMIRGKELQEYCRIHNLKITSVEEIVKYRIDNELSIRKVREIPLVDGLSFFRSETLEELAKAYPNIDSKVCVYVDDLTDREHFALVVGEPKEGALVRVHFEDLLSDVFDAIWDEKSEFQPGSLGKLDQAMEKIYSEGAGVLVYLRHQPGASGLAAQVSALGDNALELESKRDYRAAAHILVQLGLSRLNLIGASPFKKEALRNHGLELIEQAQ